MSELAAFVQSQGFSLNPPASPAAVAACEAALGCTLDARWREFLLAADGALLLDEDGETAAQWLGCQAIADSHAALLNSSGGAQPLWLPFYRDPLGICCLDHGQPSLPVIRLPLPAAQDEAEGVQRLAEDWAQWLADNETDGGLDNDNLLNMVEDLMSEYGMLDAEGEFVQAQPPAFNDYDHLGFSLHTEADVGALLQDLQQAPLSALSAPQGSYYCYRDSRQENGLALWVAVTSEGAVSSLSPYFYGLSRRPVLAQRYFPDPDNPLNGLCYAWAQDADEAASQNESQDEAEGLYPFAFSLMAFDHLQARLPLPRILTLRLCAFPQRLSYYADEAAFDAAQAGREVPYAANAFIPTGLYTEQEGDPPRPAAYFCGRISAVALCDNPLSGDEFYHLLIDTYGGSIDLLAHPDLFARQPRIGAIVEVEAWLSAAVEE